MSKPDMSGFKEEMARFRENMKGLQKDIEQNVNGCISDAEGKVAEANAQIDYLRRKQKEERRKWVADTIFFTTDKEPDRKTAKKRLVVATCVLILMSVLSEYLIHYGLFSDFSQSFFSMFFFAVSPIPLCVLTAVFGLEMGILGFGLNFLAFLHTAGAQSYLLFYLLAYIVMTDFTVRRDGYLNFKRGWKILLCQNFIVGCLTYLLFIQLGGGNFSAFRIIDIVYRFLTMVPQTTVTFLMVRMALKRVKRKYPDFYESRMTFRSSILQSKVGSDGKRHGNISQRIYYILVAEAIGLGISAAFFANLLVPSLQEELTASMDYSMQSETTVPDKADDADAEDADAEDANAETETSADPATKGTDDAEDADAVTETSTIISVDAETFEDKMNALVNELTGDDVDKTASVFVVTDSATGEGYWSKSLEDAFGWDEMEQVGRQTVLRVELGDSGIAFDIKLIMMLLCVIFPVVVIINFILQRFVALPIVRMTRFVEEFSGDQSNGGEDKPMRLEDLNVRTGDELEILGNSIREMAIQVDAYIDAMEEEAKLRENLRVAEAANAAKSNFLSNVSHEIRTPINAVLGLDEMILRETEEEQIRGYAVDIKNSGKSLLGLVNDLLDFSKIEAGKMEIIPVEYELSSVINDLINMVATKVEEKGLELKVNIDPGIPHVLFGDEIRIKQCALNVLNNAVKYTQTGTVTLEMNSRSTGEDTVGLLIRVTDTGIGIKEEDLAKLYSPFERIEEKRNRTIEGTGLGMSIVKNLLDLMGTQLVVKSVYGEGSDFSFEVEQRVVSAEPIGDFNETYRKSVSRIEEYRVSFMAPEAKVLVVDDTAMNLTVAKGLLKPTKVQVTTCAGGPETLNLVRKEHFDLIFLDQRMPEMDGVETLHRMREMEDNLCADTPVICLTANAISGAREQFIQAGFDDYLSKPIDAGRLEQTTAKYLPKEMVYYSGTGEYERLLKAEKHAQKQAAEAGDGTGAGTSADTSDAAAPGSRPGAQLPADDPLRSIEGLDIDAGLRNCMTREILEEAIHDFRVALRENADLIESSQHSDLKTYTVKVHALKSSARLIGATELSERAAYLESCGDAENTAEIERLTPELLELYRSYEDKLSVLDGPAGEADDRPEIPEEQLLEAFAGIREAAEAFDFDTADAICEMLKDYRIPEPMQTRTEEILNAVTKLDRDTLLKA
jgi:signal transduction histidine kinase/DNA-binding NarL/FixJ family response regulator/HPt (histidine-containing phosphotransfer) domain-containing protein